MVINNHSTYEKLDVWSRMSKKAARTGFRRVFFFCDRGGRKTLDLAAAFFTTCDATRGALSSGKLPGSAKSHLRGTVLRALLGK